LQRLTAALDTDQIDHDIVLNLVKWINESPEDNDESVYVMERELLAGLDVNKACRKRNSKNL
jgi:hypothetical protein